MASHRTRFLDDVIAEYTPLLGTSIKTLSKHLVHWEELNPDTNTFPALYPVFTSGGEIEGQLRRHRDVVRWALWGYVRGSDDDPSGLVTLREDFFQLVVNKILDTSSTGFQKRLQDTANANGNNGAQFVVQERPPDTDEGQIPPFGIFYLPMQVVFHYDRGAL